MSRGLRPSLLIFAGGAEGVEDEGDRDEKGAGEGDAEEGEAEVVGGVLDVADD